MKWTRKKIEFVKFAQTHLKKNVITREELKTLQQENSEMVWPAWLTNQPTHRIGWGIYRLPEIPSEFQEDTVE